MDMIDWLVVFVVAVAMTFLYMLLVPVLGGELTDAQIASNFLGNATGALIGVLLMKWWKLR